MRPLTQARAATRPVWKPSASGLRPLEGSLRADICVIGAGITGLTAAYLLARAGNSVAVLDGRGVAAGETGSTTAHLSYVLDRRLEELERDHGAAKLRLALQSHKDAIDRISSIAAEEGIDCDLESADGYLCASSPEGRAVIEGELQAARRAALSDVRWFHRSPLPGSDDGPCLRFPRQARIHPVRYLDGLVQSVRRLGGDIYPDTRVARVNGGTYPFAETETGATVSAAAVIVATHAPINDRFLVHSRQTAFRTYAIAARMPRETAPQALYWDTREPYHYARAHPVRGQRGERLESDMLIVGGEDHRTGLPDDARERYARLEAWMRPRFPAAGPVEHRWSGQILEPLDGLAFIGPSPMDHSGIYMATGYSGNGMTYGTIAGLLLTDLILGKRNPWARLYDPSRSAPRRTKDFLKENLGTAGRLAARLKPGPPSESAARLKPGSGMVVRRGLRKVAVYRDPRGGMHELSAVCTHLGCIVNWNSGESTWDCPCHGSRFDPYGKVLNCPATEDLQRAEPGEKQRRRAIMRNRKDVKIVDSLIKGEMSAIETYRQALEKVGNEPGAEDLRRIEREHEQAVTELRSKFAFQEQPTSSGVWGTWAKAVEGTAKLMGNKAAIKALKEGEEHGIKDYERALEDPELDMEAKEFIRSRLLPRVRQHVPVLDRLMQNP